MAKTKPSSGAKAQYHHGNLKQALIDVALDIVRTEGVSGISLRKVAKALDVTQTAPYSHFKDKKSLLATLAAIGFRLFAKRMSEEILEAADSKDILRGLGMGYVLFATEEPELFRLMFGEEMNGYVESEELLTSAAESYELISNAVSRSLDEQQSDRDRSTATTAAWSMVHGLATLIVDGKLDFPDNEDEKRAFIQAVDAHLLV